MYSTIQEQEATDRHSAREPATDRETDSAAATKRAGGADTNSTVDSTVAVYVYVVG